MKNIFLIVLIFISTKTAYGQIEGLSYSVEVGKYSFRPKFIYDNKPSKGVFVPGSDTDIKELIVFYAQRTDTGFQYNINGIKKKIVIKNDHYTIDYFVDSTKTSYLDTLLNSEIIIIHNDKKCKVYSIKIQFLFSDGNRVSTAFKGNKLYKTKKLYSLLNKKNNFYFMFSNIKFLNDKNEKLEINDTYGWKIKVGT